MASSFSLSSFLQFLYFLHSHSTQSLLLLPTVFVFWVSVPFRTALASTLSQPDLKGENSVFAYVTPPGLASVLLVPSPSPPSKWPHIFWPHFVQFLFLLICLSEVLSCTHSSLFFDTLPPYFQDAGRGIVCNKKF